MAISPGVLIVDDSITVRMDLDAAFRAAGFTTTLCGSAAAARDALSQSSFALIVLDVVLPDADGIDLLKEVKGAAATSGIPVLLLSTEAEVRDRVRGLRTGADEYVGKPYDAPYVIGRARELVSRGQPIQEAGARTSVLIIDDSSTFRETLGAFLNKHGYSVAMAGCGEDGLREVINLRPRAVIVDGILPGIDGATVVRRIKQDASLRQTPCMLLTGSEDSGEELRALDAGADVYVRKEEPLEVILARLAAVLRFSGDPSPRTAASPSLLGPKKLLTVDDSPTYLDELATHLREEGYEPVLARSGEEALELLAVQPVDCILLDLIMPGMSGNETCRRIKTSSVWKDIPLLILTAHEGRDAMIEGINAGADDYIAKSSDFEVLKARLRAQFRRKQSQDENRQIREQLRRDITERKQAEESLIQKTKQLELLNEELKQFAFVASHHLQEPLRKVLLFTDRLETHRTSTSDVENDCLGRIRKAALHMRALIQDLVQYSWITQRENTLERVDLGVVVGEVLMDLEGSIAESGARIQVGKLDSLRANAFQMKHLFSSLVSNSLKFARKGVPPRISIGSSLLEGGDRIEIVVEDNGIGFDEKYLDRIFRAFQQLHAPPEYQGTGIGLSICQKIVQNHGGTLCARSRPGEGAAFLITLPIHHESPRSSE